MKLLADERTGLDVVIDIGLRVPVYLLRNHIGTVVSRRGNEMAVPTNEQIFCPSISMKRGGGSCMEYMD